jgi:hypothetical protein
MIAAFSLIWAVRGQLRGYGILGYNLELCKILQKLTSCPPFPVNEILSLQSIRDPLLDRYLWLLILFQGRGAKRASCHISELVQ